MLGHIWSIDGAISTTQPEQTILSDRGLAYGDGLFETMRAPGGQIPLLDLHIQRLSEGCRRLGINLDIETCIAQIDKVLTMAMDSQDKTTAEIQDQKIVKLIVTRGGRAEGYSYLDDSSLSANIYIFLRPFNPERLKVALAQRAKLCKTRLSVQPQLAGIKHLNRLEQVLASSELADDFDEGILLNTEGKVIEAISSNLIALINDELCFPDLTCSGVKGVMQTWIQNIAVKHSMPYRTASLDLAQFLEADEIILTNSVRGVRNLEYIELQHGQNWQSHSAELGTHIASLLEAELHQDFFSF